MVNIFLKRIINFKGKFHRYYYSLCHTKTCAINCKISISAISCDNGKTYFECQQHCPKVCGSPSASCSQKCRDGCFCPEGTAFTGKARFIIFLRRSVFLFFVHTQIINVLVFQNIFLSLSFNFKYLCITSNSLWLQKFNSCIHCSLFSSY